MEQRTYHHGDLRRALLEAAMDLLTESQQWNFSLREVSRRALVSHTAPYKHFTGKEDLLAALAAQGFEQLRAALEAVSREEGSWGGRLLAVGAAYVEFGRCNPARYRLMFGTTFGSENLGTALAARKVLEDIVAGGLAADEFQRKAGSSRTQMVLAAWALVHGYTSLLIDGLAESDGADHITGLLLGGLNRRLTP